MLDLIDRARNGDSDAFGALAAASIDRLYAIAVRVVHDRDQAEDAVQSTLLKAWRDLPSLRDPARFDAWLHRLLIRACYDEAQRQRAYVASVRVVSIEPSEVDGAGQSGAIATRWSGRSSDCPSNSGPSSSCITTRQTLDRRPKPLRVRHMERGDDRGRSGVGVADPGYPSRGGARRGSRPDRRSPWTKDGTPASRLARTDGMVEMRGLEPLTPAMRTQCSSS